MNTNLDMISVIIPVYNVEKYLGRCLDSVIQNTYQNIEIICVNDGSPDNSIHILNKYAEKDFRVKVITQKNGGLSSARNTGIRNAKGEYITFIDSDDWIHPQYFELLLDSIKEKQADVTICGFSQVEEYSSNFEDYLKMGYSAQVYNIQINELLHGPKYRMFKVYACGVLYRREKILHQFPEGVKVIEDNIFNLLHLPQYTSACILNLPIYYYYYNYDSIMHTFSCDDAFKGLFWLCSFLDKETKINHNVKKEIVDFIYKRSLFYRYSFARLEDPQYAIEKTARCYETLVKHDDVIKWGRRSLYRMLVRHPGLYALYKERKSGKTDAKQFFSLAEGKQIKN